MTGHQLAEFFLGRRVQQRYFSRRTFDFNVAATHGKPLAIKGVRDVRHSPIDPLAQIQLHFVGVGIAEM